MTELVASYAAGLLSVLAPCVLPLAPVILASALQAHRLGPLAMSGGMVVAFTLSGAILGSIGLAAGLGAGTARMAAGVLMLGFGVLLLVGPLQARFAALVAPVSGTAEVLSRRFDPNGLTGQFSIGSLLGFVWVPCTGPTLGVAITLASRHESLTRVALVMLAFGLGAVSPLLLLAYGSRRLLVDKRERVLAFARVGRWAMGGVLVLIGFLVVTALDKRIESFLVLVAPDWLIELTTSI
jgi:cytochrome c biogenesis protein CcdA